MAVKKQIDTLLSKEMDRKSFLKYGGTVFLGVVGVTGLLRVILGAPQTDSIKSVGVTDPKKVKGYGSSTYGS